MATKVECLSSREHQVYALVGRGLCNKEIARELGISDGTVKLHVHRILQKLGMHNRYGIVLAHILALRPGLDNQRKPKWTSLTTTPARAKFI
jgi:DNA-binding NarL/FixJ family response regulator